MRSLVLLLALAACTPGTVVEERVIEVKVPVVVPCVVDAPDEIRPLNKKLDATTWKSMSTASRQRWVAAQSLDRMAYGDKLKVSTAGCVSELP